MKIKQTAQGFETTVKLPIVQAIPTAIPDSDGSGEAEQVFYSPTKTVYTFDRASGTWAAGGGGGGGGTITTSSPLSGDGSVLTPATIADGALGLPKIANVASGTVIGRSAGGAGAASALTTIPTATMPALTGDVTTSAGAVATTIAAQAVTMSKIVNAGAASIVGATGAGAHADLTGTQVLTIIINATTTVVTVSGAAVQDVNFTGLSGNTDGNYECKVYAPSGFGGTNLSVQPQSDAGNGEVTGTYQSHAGAPVQYANGRLQVAVGGSTAYAGKWYLASKSGRGPRLFQADFYDTEGGTTYSYTQRGWWTDTTTALTNVNFHSDNATGIPVGTVFVFRKLGEL